MIVRNCAGGVVFWDDKVFLLKNEKGEWVLPKGVIRDRKMPRDVALDRVKTEAGINAEIISAAGDTTYEFYSITRRQPVRNQVHWYTMRADTGKYRIAFELGFTDGDYFPIAQALDTITYSQDQALVRSAYEKLRQAENL